MLQNPTRSCKFLGGMEQVSHRARAALRAPNSSILFPWYHNEPIFPVKEPGSTPYSLGTAATQLHHQDSELAQAIWNWGLWLCSQNISLTKTHISSLWESATLCRPLFYTAWLIRVKNQIPQSMWETFHLMWGQRAEGEPGSWSSLQNWALSWNTGVFTETRLKGHLGVLKSCKAAHGLLLMLLKLGLQSGSKR